MIVVVIALSFVLLVLAFRSIVIPLTAGDEPRLDRGRTTGRVITSDRGLTPR
jgi:hypothetical protein